MQKFLAAAEKILGFFWSPRVCFTTAAIDARPAQFSLLVTAADSTIILTKVYMDHEPSEADITPTKVYIDHDSFCRFIYSWNWKTKAAGCSKIACSAIKFVRGKWLQGFSPKP